jgi:putative chitinase
MIHRKLFFDRVRQELFMRVLNQPQVDGMVAILDEWEAGFGDKDLRWLGYILGTVHHETAKTMQPIEEYGHGGERLYARCDPETNCAYYGRGFVQLTWRKNYERAGNELGVDLVHHPELACDLAIATKILIHGMTAGWFTGAELEDYFNDQREDWINARRIVNGLDRANLVAGYAKTYFEALI